MTGQQLFDLGKKHIGEKYVLGTLVPKSNASWKGPWDCAEFASWLAFQATGALYGCHNDVGNPASQDAYTGYWHRDAQTKGKIVTLDKAARTPGAAILRVPATGLMGHIVISDGKGGTVEAHSTKKGLITSTLSNRRWDYGILIPGVDYAALPPVQVNPPDHVIYRYTHPVMVSPVIGRIQKALKAAGYDPKGTDNIFGPDTMNAVLAFQEAKGLVVDGEAGPDTATALGITL